MKGNGVVAKLCMNFPYYYNTIYLIIVIVISLILIKN